MMEGTTIDRRCYTPCLGPPPCTLQWFPPPCVCTVSAAAEGAETQSAHAQAASATVQAPQSAKAK